MNIELSLVKETVLNLLPNREDVRAYIWSELSGPLDTDLHLFLIEQIEEYGSWKEKLHGNGQFAYSGWIYKNKKQGRWLNYYKNGSPHKDCMYKNSEYHGLCTIWAVDGNYTVSEYYKGKLNGKERSFSSCGVLRRTCEYEMGRWIY